MLEILAVVVLFLMCAFAVSQGIPGYDPRVRVKKVSLTRPSPENMDGFGGTKAYASSVTYPGMFVKTSLPPMEPKEQRNEQEARREVEKALQ